jgi:hypothetical protein
MVFRKTNLDVEVFEMPCGGILRKTRLRKATRHLRQAAAESQGKVLTWLGKGDGVKTRCGWGFGGFGRY